MTKLQSLLKKLSETNWLFLLTAFLFVFIPLYPKLPLADIIPGYLVRIRLEDFAVLFVSLVWIIQFLRKKIEWNTFFFWLVVGYLLIGLSSILSGIFLNHTIPAQLLHIGKSALHLFRYAEYFALFVIGFSALTSSKQLNVLYKLLLATVLAITIYGAGQKYLQWPVYSTMNREYSKGQALTLGEHAKVQSTFGGHYDLAAYLVIVLPLLFNYFLSAKKWRTKIITLVVEMGGWWMMVLSGSKTSLLAAGLAHLIVLALYLNAHGFFKKMNWLKLIKISLTGVVAISILLASIFVLNKDMAAAFLNLSTKVPVIGSVVSKFYTTGSDSTKPQDWIVNQPIYEEKKVVLDNGEEVIELVKKELEWSPNALKYGISMGIRLDTLWPNAITALRRNPYVGSSYGNLNKVALEEFTDSDSTDNNYLRTLGETGLLGFVTFYGLIILLLVTFVKATQSQVNPTTVYSQAMVGVIIGLLINAFYIDIFAASKVAFIFWLIAGVTLKSIYITKPDFAKKLDLSRFNFVKNKWFRHWPIAIALLILGLLTWRNPYLDEFTMINKFNFKGDDYQNMVLAKCLVDHNQFSLCRSENSSAIGLPVNFSPIYAFILAPIYTVFSHPNAYYFVNYALFNFTLILVYLSLRKVIKNRLVEFILLALFVLNPLFRETVFKSTSTNLVMWAIAMIIYLKLQLIPHFKRLYTVFFNHPATSITLVVGGILLTLGLIKHTADPLLKDFKQDANSNVYKTIKRANLSFNHQWKKQPYLITTINPYFFELYGNNNYQLLPYTPAQDLYQNAKEIWGDFNFDYQSAKSNNDLEPLYKKILSENPLYFTNYAVGDFSELRRRFSFVTADLDCDEHCNLYQLSVKTEPKKDLEPTIYNKISLKAIFPNATTSPKQNFNFTVVGHTYPDLNLKENQTPPGQVERYNELQLANRLNSLTAQPADFLVFLGDLTTRLEDSRFTYFDRFFTKNFAKPIINAQQTINPRIAQEYFEPFSIGDTYFLRLKTLNTDTLEKGELIKFYNLYFDLEYSSVDYLFILSYQDLRDNKTFMEKVVPLLNQLTNKSIYVMAGNGGELNQKVQNDQLVNVGNITFLKTGFNETTPESSINISVDPISGVNIKQF